MATLIVTHGPASGQVFALGEHGIVMIGRDQECTFQILDPLGRVTHCLRRPRWRRPRGTPAREQCPHDPYLVFRTTG